MRHPPDQAGSAIESRNSVGPDHPTGESCPPGPEPNARRARSLRQRHRDFREPPVAQGSLFRAPGQRQHWSWRRRRAARLLRSWVFGTPTRLDRPLRGTLIRRGVMRPPDENESRPVVNHETAPMSLDDDTLTIGHLPERIRLRRVQGYRKPADAVVATWSSGLPATRSGPSTPTTATRSPWRSPSSAPTPNDASPTSQTGSTSCRADHWHVSVGSTGPAMPMR